MYGHHFYRLAGLLFGASVLGCSTSDLSLPSDSNPARITIVSGDGQEAAIGSLLPDPLVVRLTDASTRPVAGASLVFSFQGPAPDAVVNPGTAETDSTGLASVRARLGTTVGTQIVEARLNSDAGSDLRATFGMTALQPQNNGGGGSGGGGNAGGAGGNGGGGNGGDGSGGSNDNGGGDHNGKHKDKDDHHHHHEHD
jgi:hypothetical protein